jgi:hypothetical protein
MDGDVGHGQWSVSLPGRLNPHRARQPAVFGFKALENHSGRPPSPTRQPGRNRRPQVTHRNCPICCLPLSDCLIPMLPGKVRILRRGIHHAFRVPAIFHRHFS